MATLFPFNQLPKIPSIILDQIMPIILEQQAKLTDLANELIDDNINLSPNASCDDAQIAEIKNKLQEAQTLIDNLRGLLDFLPSIIVAFNTIKTIGSVLGTIQLAIPAVPGVPTGPITQLLNAASELIENIDAAIKKLRVISDLADLDFGNIGNSILRSSETLENICNESTSLADLAATGAFGPNNTISGTFITDQDILNQFPSEFYQPINVSDPDIQARLDLIRQLLAEQLDVVLNINEAPSQVIVQSGLPVDTIGQLGDYWINSSTQQVYGPKPSDSSWT